MERVRSRIVANTKFKELLKDYCSKSTIHGVQYVGDPDRPIYEKLFWIVIFIFTSLCNFYLIWETWTRWQESPVIVSFADTTTPVWKIPFPAITICPSTVTKNESLMTGYPLKTSEEENLKKSAVSVFCDKDYSKTLKLIDDWSTHYIVDSAPDMYDTLIGCKINGIASDCETIFNPILTDSGLCFTYNVLSRNELFREPWGVTPYPDELPKSDDWNLEEGYKRGSPIETYPYRGVVAGDKSGLNVILAGNISNHDAACTSSSLGFSIAIHNPAELPSKKSKFVIVPSDQEVLVWIDPDIITTSESLRSYSPERRQCFFSDERYLKYFKVYTERNCEIECMSNHTMQTCGCVPVYMPRDRHQPVCGGGNKDCMQQAIKETQDRETGDSDNQICNCLPSCTSISYQAEVSQTDFDWKPTLVSSGEVEDISELDDEIMSRVSIYLSKTYFTTSHRSELFGVVDFLSYCGGLLALFSGISFLSFLEIFYFATFRPYGNMKIERENQRNQPENSDLLEKIESPPALNN